MIIRKCESFVTEGSTEFANLNPEKFRHLSIPYVGDSEKEFLLYIQEVIENDKLWSELDEETSDELSKLTETPDIPYWYSTNKTENIWFESGERDETMRKNGGFKTNETTQGDNDWSLM